MCLVDANDAAADRTPVKRPIHEIIWHCSASKEDVPVRVEQIRDRHVNGNGWWHIGCHIVVELDGSVEAGGPVSRQGAHVRGHNRDSLGICCVRGLDAAGKPKDARTPAQRDDFYRKTVEPRARFPSATVQWPQRFWNKACPCFDVRADWQSYVQTLPVEPEPIEAEYPA